MLRWVDGFEVRQHSTFFGELYASVSGPTISSAVGGRAHGAAISAANLSLKTPNLVPGGDENTWIVQFAFRKQDLEVIDGASEPGLTIYNTAGAQLQLLIVDPGSPNTGMIQFKVKRGATVLATSGVLDVGSGPKAWHVFQFKATIRTSTNGSFEMIRFDHTGAEHTVFASTTSVNTANQAVDGANAVKFSWGTQAGPSIRMDDLIVMDGSGSRNNDFSATMIVVHGSLANGEGAVQNFIPSTGSSHYTLIDEDATSPGGSDELTSNITGDVELFEFADFPLIPDTGTPTIVGVAIDVEAQMKNSGDRTLRARVKTGGNTADGTDDLFYDIIAKMSKMAILEQNPTGGIVDWSLTNLESSQYGVHVTA